MRPQSTSVLQDAALETIPSHRRLCAALLASVLMHLSVLYILKLPQPEQSSFVDLEILSPEPSSPETSFEEQPKQFVSPSETTSSVPPLETAKLSDKDSSTPKEEINRGQPDAGATVEQSKAEVPIASPSTSQANSAKAPKQAPQEKQLARAPAPREATKTPQGKQPNLRLSEDILSREFSRAAAPPVLGAEERLQAAARNQAPESDGQRDQKLLEYEPFRRGGQSALFQGRRGSADYLPEIPDGDITLLNAKADRHAVFVRRVALQVFGALRRLSWAELSFESLRNLRDYATVEAVLSPEGKLLSVEISDSSGTRTFDTLVLQAAQKGSWDQNPPVTARAADGNIHFVFKAKTWARRIGEGGTQEQRWLLLATGLL